MHDVIGLLAGLGWLVFCLPLMLSALVGAVLLPGLWLAVRVGLQWENPHYTYQPPLITWGYPLLAVLIGAEIVSIRLFIPPGDYWWHHVGWHLTAVAVGVLCTLTVLVTQRGDTIHNHSGGSLSRAQYRSPTKVLWYCTTPLTIYLLIVLSTAVFSALTVPPGWKVLILGLGVLWFTIAAYSVGHSPQTGYVHTLTWLGRPMRCVGPYERAERANVRDTPRVFSLDWVDEPASPPVPPLPHPQQVSPRFAPAVTVGPVDIMSLPVEGVADGQKTSGVEG